MPALNFQSRFAAKVLDGTKPGTIRAKRKRPIKVGDRLYLYTGQRTKHSRKLKEVVCHGVFDIVITKSDILINGIALYESMKEGFARLDGFNSYSEFLQFFTARGDFNGDHIVWSEEFANGEVEYTTNSFAATHSLKRLTDEELIAIAQSNPQTQNSTLTTKN